MTRGSRKKKRNKQRKSARVLSPSPKTVQSMPLPTGVDKLRPDSTVLISKQIFVAAPADSCFSTLASQLEQPHWWDATIVNVKPVSKVRERIGATSQITMNLGGRKLESLVMVSRYHPNRAIGWVSTGKPKVREDWRLYPNSHGTTVTVTLANEVKCRALGRLLYKILLRKKVERDLDRMLTQLKAVVENSSRDQRATGE